MADRAAEHGRGADVKPKGVVVTSDPGARTWAVHAVWDGHTLEIRFADGYVAHVPASDVLEAEHDKTIITSITLGARGPHGITIRFGRKRSFYTWDYLRAAGSGAVDPPEGLVPPTCSFCGQATCFSPRTRPYRRRNREIVVQSGYWTCINCSDPYLGTRPFRFTDSPLMRWKEEQVRRVWRETYGEEMPTWPGSERGEPGSPSVDDIATSRHSDAAIGRNMDALFSDLAVREEQLRIPRRMALRRSKRGTEW